MILEEIILPQAYHPPRDQGTRPTCIAFALADVELAAAAGQVALSPEYLYQSAARQSPEWMPGSGVSLRAALAAASAGQPVEDDYPYQMIEPESPIPPLPHSFDLYGLPVRYYQVDIPHVLHSLQSGFAIGFGLHLTRSFYHPHNGVVGFEAEVRPGTLHAVSAVGVGKGPGDELYFLVRNSWGKSWGINGNAWLPLAYVQTHTLCTFGV